MGESGELDPSAPTVRGEPTPPPNETSSDALAKTGVAETGGANGSSVAGLAPGTRVHQYELVRELGRGGMGCVYAARDTKLGRKVAIKFLLHANKQVAERFLVEARATAQCSHDNIVIVHEVDEYEEMPYLVLEYLEGQPLAGLIRRGKLPAGRAVELALPIARALARAHEMGIVHRDLKPENVFVTHGGQVKVLDFGIAKARGETATTQRTSSPSVFRDLGLTKEGALVGTLPYMSPEQLGTEPVDHRSDLWALGVLMFEMIAGRHPVQPLTAQNLIQVVSATSVPMPSVREAAPDVPEALASVIDGLLRKKKADRLASADQVVRALEALAPGRAGRALAEGESPYPGLVPFQEGDADRYFGRARDVSRMVARIRERPLTGVVGPSGVGKSSFVRAGVGPALKASGESWEIVTLRPGRAPLVALASVLQQLTTRSGDDAIAQHIAEHEGFVEKLRTAPGTLGAVLRSRARTTQTHILLFVDQFEELYTLVDDREERLAFTAALSGVADDAATPLRVVVSMRSDFLDRIAEDPRFMDELSRGLVFLGPPTRDGLRDALVQPIEMVGYRFESDAMIDDMLGALEATPGALPLLQFAAAKLWDARDRSKHVLAASTYQQMGGVVGALAAHADEVVSSMDAAAQKIARGVFQRLVTPERTRAIEQLDELDARVVEQLAAARLIVVQAAEGGGGGTVEIVHESLIERWPTLRRWLDEDQEDAALVAQLRTAAKQWEARGRPAGLLWRGEALDDARRWERRRPRELPARDRAFLDAALASATRSARMRRIGFASAFALLAAIAAGAVIAMFSIRGAKQEAEASAKRATEQMNAATAAKQKAMEALEAREAEERQRKQAEDEKSAAQQRATVAEVQRDATLEDLQRSNAQLLQALEEAKAAEDRAKTATQKAEQAKRELESANQKLSDTLAHEQARVKELEDERKTLSTKLKDH
ncbi:MAG TPA: protein kinase [Kofleriaceae bacterium]|nr:protein kinase [Kofleriaceae bacterium]